MLTLIVLATVAAFLAFVCIALFVRHASRAHLYMQALTRIYAIAIAVLIPLAIVLAI